MVDDTQETNLKLYQRHLHSINLNTAYGTPHANRIGVQTNKLQPTNKMYENKKHFDYVTKFKLDAQTPYNNTDYAWQTHNHELYCKPGFRNDEYDTSKDPFFTNGYTIPTKVNTQSNIMGLGGSERILDESTLLHSEPTRNNVSNGNIVERPINRFHPLFKDVQNVNHVVQDWPRTGIDTRQIGKDIRRIDNIGRATFNMVTLDSYDQ